jgi:hypothetical protein
MQISADIQKAVVFFGMGDERTPSYGGTGFMLTYKGWSWLVTARHVAKLLDCPFWIRGNWGQPNYHDNATWHHHPHSDVDVSVAAYSVSGNGIGNLPEDSLLTDEIRPHYDVNLGNFTYTIGLFKFLPGQNRSLTVVHTGFIARLPEPEEPIRSKNNNCASYLVQAPHLGGLSGAPVFVRRTHYLTAPDYLEETKVAAGSVALMGLWSSGYYGEPVPEYELGGNKTLPIGFGVVIPADRIVETIDDYLKKNLPGPPDEVLAEGDTAFKKPGLKRGDKVLGRMLRSPPDPK